MNFAEGSGHLRLLHILLVDVVNVASPAAKVEGEVAPSLLLHSQHLGDVIGTGVVCVREGAPHRHPPAHSKLVDIVGLGLEEGELGGSDHRDSPSPRLRLLDHWDRQLRLLWGEGLRRMIGQ